MVLGLNSLPLRESGDHRQELRSFRPGDMSLSQRPRAAEWTRGPGEDVGYEQLGSQRKQESDS